MGSPIPCIPPRALESICPLPGYPRHWGSACTLCLGAPCLYSPLSTGHSQCPSELCSASWGQVPERWQWPQHHSDPSWEMLLPTPLTNPRFCDTGPQSLGTERIADSRSHPPPHGQQQTGSHKQIPIPRCAQPTQVNVHSPRAASGDCSHCSGCATPAHLLRWPKRSISLPREDTRGRQGGCL